MPQHNVKEMKEKLSGHLGQIVFVAGIIGILLLFLSSFIGGKSPSGKTEATSSDATGQYVENMENELTGIVSELLGDKNVSVMITLKSGIQYIYAGETKTDTGLSEDKSGSDSLKKEQSDTNEQTYIIVKDSDGNEQPLLITEVMPQVKGVVVICSGGDDKNVQQTVQNAVVTVLDISENKVCVIGRQSK